MDVKKKNLIIYIFLTVVTLAVFWQAFQFDFVNFDDDVYVTENRHVQEGLTADSVKWAFSTVHAEFWHPLTWLSLMLDFQIYGLNAGGYHITNVILHIFSILMLFWVFNRMTGSIWRSAFIAAVFAVHPLRLESVVWVSKRKDVLCAFFWMLTLCLYVYYTEKPVLKRYLMVLASFVLALMSKPMVITLPVIMILLDYWPLNRFKSMDKNWMRWELKEKIPLFILSAVFSVLTLHAQYSPVKEHFSLYSRFSFASVSFVTYLGKIFWPNDLCVYYPFPEIFPPWQALAFALLIIAVSVFLILSLKRLPYLFVGWMWFAIAILPVIGISQIGPHLIKDHYTYLPSIGISVMLAWGMPALLNSGQIRKKILFPASVILIAALAVWSWQQCAYWKNGITLFSHALDVTKKNYLAYNNRAINYGKAGRYQQAIDDLTKSIEANPEYYRAYHNRGIVYEEIGRHQLAIRDADSTIRLKPDYADAYFNRGVAYGELGLYEKAIEDFSKTISLQPDNDIAYFNRGSAYFMQGNIPAGCSDAKKACEMGNCKLLENYEKKGACR